MGVPAPGSAAAQRGARDTGGHAAERPVAALRALRFEGRSLVLDPRASAAAVPANCALIRPTAVTIAPADLELIRPGGAPFTPGCEFVGIVEAVHEAVPPEQARAWVGQRVVGSPLIACSACDLCRAGLSTHCRARRHLGRPGWDGCLADRFALPIRNLLTVPPALDDDRAAFAWAVSSAVHAARIVRIEGKHYVTVLGDTTEGLLIAQVAARLNAAVRLLGTRPERLALCEKWQTGIKHRLASEAGRRQDQDVVIECTGTEDGLAQALQLVRPRGSVVLARPIDSGALSSLTEREITLIGAGAGSIAEGVSLLARAEVDVLGIISRRFKLQDGPRAFAAAADPGCLRVLVDT